MTVLLIGAVVVFAAALLGGVIGFGYGLIATPLLLLAGLSLPEVVVVNLSVALLTRIVVVWRFRGHLVARRAAQLVLGSLPGIGLGLAVRGSVDTAALEVGAGLVAVVAALCLLLRSERAAPRRLPAGAGVAGTVGGFLGATTSLNGVAPALLLTHDRARPLSFIADLAAYFVASNTLTLAVLFVTGHAAFDHVGGYLLGWVPVGLAGNLLGMRLAPRLPQVAFRRLALALVIVAGCVTVADAL